MEIFITVYRSSIGKHCLLFWLTVQKLIKITLEPQILRNLILKDMLQFLHKSSMLLHMSIRNASSSTAAVTKIHRAIYPNMYNTLVVNSNGSTYRIRYYEPRSIIKLPFDLSQLSESEKRLRLEKRKPKSKVKIEQEVDDKFSANKYVKFLKRK